MAAIALLDQDTIDKIAAGEVIERPSSVVKELVENAIDAGATAVKIEIRDGGTSLIRITDNGMGIAPEQVALAFLRHSTSKLHSASELSDIHSLGFRGEALSSIAAVSRVEMITKTADSLTGIRYVIEGGKELVLEETGAPDGTTFFVKDLFYNTPARRKFLKTPHTEGGYISDLVERLALSRPEISFQLINNGQTKLHSSGNGSIRDLIYHVYGRDITASLLPISYEGEFFSMEGYIGMPVVTRGNRNFENYYINLRYVKSTMIARAIEEAYQGFIMQHQYPFCVLYLTFDGGKLDVNVHPTKMELRIAQGREVASELCRAVRQVLAGQELIPQVPAGKEPGPGKRAGREPGPGKRDRKDGAPSNSQSVNVDGSNVSRLPQTPVEGLPETEVPVSTDSRPRLGRKVQEDRLVYGAQAADRVTPSVEAEDANTVPEAAKADPAAASMGVSAARYADKLAEPREDTHVLEQIERRVADIREGLLKAQLGRIAERGGIEPSSPVNRSGSSSQPASQSMDELEVSSPVSRSGSSSQPASQSMDELEVFSPVSRSGSSSQPASQSMDELEVFSPVSRSGSSSQPVSQSMDELEVSSQVSRSGSSRQPGYNPVDEIEVSSCEEIRLSDIDKAFLSEEARSSHRIIGQLFGTYWLVEYEEKLYIIDQHAAHEKVLYEKMMARLREKEFTSQLISPPIILTLDGRETEMLERYRPQIELLGYEIEHFGGREYQISAVPGNLYHLDMKDLFIGMLDDFSNLSGKANPQLITEKVASMSCKAAVKGNSRLSMPEIEQLITDLLSLENPYNCPHGRPTIISMTKYEIEKGFKRIV